MTSHDLRCACEVQTYLRVGHMCKNCRPHNLSKRALQALRAHHVGMLVVVDKVAVGHEGQVLRVAVAARLRGHHFVCDEVGQERGAHRGREAHVACLHRRRLQRKYLVPCTLQRLLGRSAIAHSDDDEERHKRDAHGGREAHVACLHKRWLQGKYSIPCTLHPSAHEQYKPIMTASCSGSCNRVIEELRDIMTAIDRSASQTGATQLRQRLKLLHSPTQCHLSRITQPAIAHL